jgi:hypothetical protein
MSQLLSIREAASDLHERAASLCESEMANAFPLFRGLMVAAPMSLVLWALIILAIGWMLG